MAGPEKVFENEVKKYLNSLPNCWYIKIWGGGFMKAGIPDILGVINGKFIALELKAPHGKPSELQKRNIRLINQCGGLGVILYPKDFEKFKEGVKKLYVDSFNE